MQSNHNEGSSTQRLAAIAGKSRGPNGELINGSIDEDAREEAELQLQQKREIKEEARIVKRFKVITLADPEIQCMFHDGDQVRETDSWCNNNTAAGVTLANSARQAADSSSKV